MVGSSSNSFSGYGSMDSGDIWESIALENILHDVAQALDIEDEKVGRIADILFKVDERIVRSFELRIREVLEQYLESRYGSLASYYSSMGMKPYMEPLISKLKKELLECITNMFRGAPCDYKNIIKAKEKEFRLMFLKRRKAFMRIDYHNKRLAEIFQKMTEELEHIIAEYEERKSPEKKLLEACLRLTESIRDSISYYNFVWAIGFLFKALEFKGKERHLILILTKTFEGILNLYTELAEKDENEATNMIREVSDLTKKVFLYLAYYPELSKDSRFLDKLPKSSEGLVSRLKELLDWLETDRTYGQLDELIEERYEEEVQKIFSGKLQLDIEKILRIVEDLENSLSGMKNSDISVSLHLIHSLLFHQKAIQHVLSFIKNDVLKSIREKLQGELEAINRELEVWDPFYRNPELLPRYMEDIVGEINASIAPGDIEALNIENLAVALRDMPILSISILSVEYPETFLVVANYILEEEKPGNTWEVNLRIKVNGKYGINRKCWIGKNSEGRVFIEEKFESEDIEREYVSASYSLYKKPNYRDYLENKVACLKQKIGEIKKKFDDIGTLEKAIDQALHYLMSFDAENFRELLKEKKLAQKIRRIAISSYGG